MKKNILTVLCILLVMCFCGCVVVSYTGTGNVSGKGNPEKYEITVGEYSKIKVEGNCEIQYYAVPSNIVTLEVQPNLREYFVVEVQNNELVVRTTKRISYNSGKIPVVTVSTPTLNSLVLGGVCTLKAFDIIKADAFYLELSGAGTGKAELDVNSLKISVSGTASFELSGRADSADISLSGSGGLEAFSLHTREASVDLSGAGAIRISCSEKLYIKASGAGKVEYKGSPSLSLNTSGVVNIKKAD